MDWGRGMGRLATGIEASRLADEAEAEGRIVYRQRHGVHVEAYDDSCDDPWPFPTSRRPFDWLRDCPVADIAPKFSPIVGEGRGVIMGARVDLRDTLLWLQGRDAEVDPEALRTLNAGQARTY